MNDTTETDQDKKKQAFLQKVMAGLTHYETSNEETEKLGNLAAEMEDVNEAWYANATRVFPAGTPEGDMIRGTIPTTYVPKAKEPATPATP
ncbi:MAG: hypothetical protein ABIT37_25140 [Luteolibacter sp.]